MESETLMDYNWCHGPACHRKHTQDRIRGVKGSKVLRTRKISQSNEYIRNSVWSVFCSQTCYTEFFYKYWRQVIAIAPRLEALETPIEVEVVQREDWRGNPYKTKVINDLTSDQG